MNSITQYQKTNGLTDEAMSKLISEKLGRDISVKGLDSVKRRKEAPVAWLSALGISPREPGALKDAPPKKTEPESSGTSAAIGTIVPLPFEPISAKASIEMVYAMAGKGVAMGTHVPAIGEAWAMQAPALADAWIEWAKTNRTVANGIAMLTAGGPGGQVVLLNASLIITSLMMIQNAKAISFIPPGMSEEDIRARTENEVDERLGNS